MTSRRNPAAQAVRTPKFRPRIVASKKAYRRRPKHTARAADAFLGCAYRAGLSAVSGIQRAKTVNATAATAPAARKAAE